MILFIYYYFYQAFIIDVTVSITVQTQVSSGPCTNHFLIENNHNNVVGSKVALLCPNGIELQSRKETLQNLSQHKEMTNVGQKKRS